MQQQQKFITDGKGLQDNTAYEKSVATQLHRAGGMWKDSRHYSTAVDTTVAHDCVLLTTTMNCGKMQQYMESTVGDMTGFSG